ncbi:hypothetical protein BN1002_00230 [Bacillus sp. B-jedd]|nr:hypothetical protein BN1002_00230 [Bacillus sp. B-jedd]
MFGIKWMKVIAGLFLLAGALLSLPFRKRRRAEGHV